MKVSQLVAAFQRFATTQNNADGARPVDSQSETPKRIDITAPDDAAETGMARAKGRA